jgi:uncharacterized protein (UPF0276 family)
MKTSDTHEFLGAGLRPHHYPQWKEMETLPILEVLSDNYLFQKGGPGLHHLSELAERTAIVLHGVGLNIGGHIPLPDDYLQSLKGLIERTRPLLVSDHLCFTATNQGQSFDLLPVERTQKELLHIQSRIHKVQEVLDRPLTLEYVSTYVQSPADELSQSQFLNALAETTGCGILLDVNNVHVCAKNHGFDAWEEIQAINPRHVHQYHVAGHAVHEDYLHDTHAETICGEVWALLNQAFQSIGPRPCIVERDDDAPFAVLMAELERARGVLR